MHHATLVARAARAPQRLSYDEEDGGSTSVLRTIHRARSWGQGPTRGVARRGGDASARRSNGLRWRGPCGGRRWPESAPTPQGEVKG
jgi:hypothetical protein